MDFNSTLAAFLLRPRQAAAAVARPERLAEGLAVYAAALAAGGLYYASLPQDLPAAFLEYFPYLTRPLPGPTFWFKMMALGTVFFLIETAGLWGWIRLQRGRVAFPAVLSLLCWIHLFYLLMFLGMQVGVWVRSAALAYLVEVGCTLWSLLVATLGLREVSGLSVGRSLLGLVLASLLVVAALFAAKAAGLVGPEEMQVLLLF